MKTIMKKMNTLVTLLLICAMAQSQSSYTSIQYKKTMQPALRLELPNTTQDVEGTILNRLKQTGYKPETEGHLFWKGNKIDGFYIFNDIVLPSMGSQKLDMYFKVVQKSKEEKANSTVYLLVSAGNENFSSPEQDTALWNNARTFLDGFADKTVAYSLEQDILRQESTLTESQTKLTSLRKDGKDMEEKLKKLQDDILNNKNSQSDQQADIGTKEKSLQDLKLKRKP